MPISYSQGLADLNFINDFCHQNLIDYEVNSTTGKLLSRDGRLVTTNMRQRLQTESIFKPSFHNNQVTVTLNCSRMCFLGASFLVAFQIYFGSGL